MCTTRVFVAIHSVITAPDPNMLRCCDSRYFYFMSDGERRNRRPGMVEITNFAAAAIA